jgi:hypothetical protein
MACLKSQANCARDNSLLAAVVFTLFFFVSMAPAQTQDSAVKDWAKRCSAASWGSRSCCSCCCCRMRIDVETAKKPGNQAALELEIGKVFEDYDRLKEAEAAYVKALEADDTALRDQASESLRRVVKKQHSRSERYFIPLGEWLASGTAKILSSIVVVAVLLGLLWYPSKWIGQWKTANKLTVLPLVDTTRRNINLSFVEFLKVELEDVRDYYKKRDPFFFARMPASRSPLPLYVEPPSPLSPELKNLIEDASSKPLGGLLSYFKQKFFVPEYTISGLFGKAAREYNVLLRLERRRKLVQTWDESFPVADLGDGERSVAFRIALYLKEYVK